MTSLGTVITVAIGVGLVVAACLGFCWLFARLYCRPERRSPSGTPADDGTPFSHVTFFSEGKRLDGWFIPHGADPSRRPAIVMAHGWSNSKAQMLGVAKQLHDAGFGALLYDARGHGNSESDGPVTIVKFAEDLAAAVEYLGQRMEIDATRVGVVGHSLGGAAAILAASTDGRIRAMVSSSAFADPATLTRGIMRARHLPRGPFLWIVCRIIESWLGASMEEVAPLNRIRHVAAPMLLVHGEADDFVPPSDLDVLFSHAPRDRARKWLMPGRHHADVVRDPEYGARVVEFFKENLAS